VNVHDFGDKRLGKVVPCGVYDMIANTGFVSVGITSHTAEFAVQSEPARMVRVCAFRLAARPMSKGVAWPAWGT
jgi:hypothetical protein